MLIKFNILRQFTVKWITGRSLPDGPQGLLRVAGVLTVGKSRHGAGTGSNGPGEKLLDSRHDCGAGLFTH